MDEAEEDEEAVDEEEDVVEKLSLARLAGVRCAPWIREVTLASKVPG